MTLTVDSPINVHGRSGTIEEFLTRGEIKLTYNGAGQITGYSVITAEEPERPSTVNVGNDGTVRRDA